MAAVIGILNPVFRKEVDPALEHERVSFLIKSAISGDSEARENLIEYYRPYILKEAQRFCRRSLAWGRDEELSIALIAFNEAIDAYQSSKGSSFNTFTALVIKRRLIDYIRQSGKINDFPDHENLIATAVIDEDWDRSERETEIIKYRLLLEEFNITFNLVAKTQPRHKQTRDRLRKAAKTLAADQEMMDYLRATGKLPKSKLCNLAGVTSRMLDRGRIYIIALALLLSRKDLPHLQGYARELAGKGEQ